MSGRAGYATLLRAIAALVFLCAFDVSMARAQTKNTPSSDQILEALKAKGKLRSSAPMEPAKVDEHRKLIETLKAKAARGLSAQERAQLASVAKERPSVDLVIYFDFNSAEISAKAMATLVSLGQALSSADLKGVTFLVAGHTDGLGAADYNQTLSERRARAVKTFLAGKFSLQEDQLLAVGYGKEQLKNADPSADENRRVQVVNLGK
jgi:outer membrane protein OmpA-like peptidoglycan-associated protein